MSQIIPPLLSSSPPPLVNSDIDDNEDDEFGEFANASASALDSTYGCETLSIPNSPSPTPTALDQEQQCKEQFDSNVVVSKESNNSLTKDFQDKRKVPTEDSQNLILHNVMEEIDIKVEDDTAKKDSSVPSYTNVVLNDGEMPLEEPPDILNDSDDNKSLEFYSESNLNSFSIDDNDLEDAPFEDMDLPPIPLEKEGQGKDSAIETFENCDNRANSPEAEEIVFSNQLQSNNDSISLESTAQDNNSTEPEGENNTFGIIKTPLNNDEDDFDDFADFASAPGPFTAPATQLSTEANEDDFGDFEGAENSTRKSSFCENVYCVSSLIFNSEDVYEKSSTIISEVFKGEQAPSEEYIPFDFLQGDRLFQEIQDITETNALSYQWSKSKVQQGLLKSLNIDVRNILYGCGNSMLMPKFASNLSSAPLEPVRSAIAPSKMCEQPLESNEDIPRAQFDWSESGLANPLDDPNNQSSTVLLDLEQLVASLDLNKVINSTANTIDANSDLELDWDSWVNSISDKEPHRKVENIENIEEDAKIKFCDTESVNSLQFVEMSQEVKDVTSTVPSDLDRDSVAVEHNITDLKEYPEYLVSKGHSMIPLRETYIDKVNSEGFEETNTLEESSKTQTPNFSSEQFADNDDDDEFTEFQTSVPQVAPTLKKEPNILQPSVVSCLEPVKLSSNQSVAQTIWPDPGITEDELERLNAYYSNKKDDKIVEQKAVTSEGRLKGSGGSIMVEHSVVLPADKVILPSNEIILPPQNKVVISKDLVLPILDCSPRKYTPQKAADDDDWGEFVFSNASSSSVSKRNELSLSIPQLSNLQPQKAPIPVITPSGLVQTKIPSSGLPPTSPVRATVSSHHFKLHAEPQRDGYQPAIISNHYATHMGQSSVFTDLPKTNQFSNGLMQQSKIGPHEKLNGFHDDGDEWSDFMSSQPIPTPNSIYNASGLSGNPIVNGNHRMEASRNFSGYQVNFVQPESKNRETSLNGFPKKSASLAFSSEKYKFPDLEYANSKINNSSRQKK